MYGCELGDHLCQLTFGWRDNSKPKTQESCTTSYGLHSDAQDAHAVSLTFDGISTSPMVSSRAGSARDILVWQRRAFSATRASNTLAASTFPMVNASSWTCRKLTRCQILRSCGDQPIVSSCTFPDSLVCQCNRCLDRTL